MPIAKTKKQKSKKRVLLPNSDSDSDSVFGGIEPFKDGEGIPTPIKKKYVLFQGYRYYAEFIHVTAFPKIYVFYFKNSKSNSFLIYCS